MKNIFIAVAILAILVLELLFFHSYAPSVPRAEGLLVPEWMLERVDTELRQYKSAFTEQSIKNIDKLVANPANCLVRFEIVNNKLYVSDYSKFDLLAFCRAKIIQDSLKRILEKNKINNTTFVMLAYDSYLQHEFEQRLATLGLNITDIIPIFTEAVDKRYKKGSVLFVDDFILANRGFGYWAGWRTISQQILADNKRYNWEKKLDLVFWRGKRSDDSENTKVSYRELAVEMAKKYTDKLDMRFSAAGYRNDKNIFARMFEVFSLEFSFGEFLSKQDQVKYKMLLNLDGYTCTYPGYLWRLLSNSVTFKQDSYNEQWFYSALKPWVHYVPVKHDLEDLLSKVDWVLANDDKARLIADNSTDFVKSNLMPVHIDLYIITLLNRYSDLFDFKINKPTLDKA